MIKADNTQKRCFVACDEQTRKNGRCSCLTNTHQALQLKQTGVSGRSEQLCGNLDENYNCKNMCLTRCVNGKKFYK